MRACGGSKLLIAYGAGLRCAAGCRIAGGMFLLCDRLGLLVVALGAFKEGNALLGAGGFLFDRTLAENVLAFADTEVRRRGVLVIADAGNCDRRGADRLVCAIGDGVIGVLGELGAVELDGDGGLELLAGVLDLVVFEGYLSVGKRYGSDRNADLKGASGGFACELCRAGGYGVESGLADRRDVRIARSPCDVGLGLDDHGRI